MGRTYGRFEQGNPEPRIKRRSRRLTKPQEFIRGLDAIYIIALLLTLYMLFFRVVVVVGPSMYDTLIHGDRVVLLSSLVYNDPKPGDIVVCSKESFEDGNCFVKRVIATEGQEVNIDFNTGVVYVDKEPIMEDYLYSQTFRDEGTKFPLVVAPGYVFVMGDNRQNSLDSRSPKIGQVDKRQIVGKALFILFPGDDEGRENLDLSRIGPVE